MRYRTAQATAGLWDRSRQALHRVCAGP